MTIIDIIANTYQPARCGVAHYTARLRDALSEQGIQSIVLTTYATASFANNQGRKGRSTELAACQPAAFGASG